MQQHRAAGCPLRDLAYLVVEHVVAVMVVAQQDGVGSRWAYPGYPLTSVTVFDL
jgi:hypothetical protein